MDRKQQPQQKRDRKGGSSTIPTSYVRTRPRSTRKDKGAKEAKTGSDSEQNPPSYRKEPFYRNTELSTTNSHTATAAPPKADQQKDKGNTNSTQTKWHKTALQTKRAEAGEEVEASGQARERKTAQQAQGRPPPQNIATE